MSINQGGKYKNSKQQLIEQGFTSGRGREGFSGILGPNSAMDNVIANDTANTYANANMFNNNIAQYGTDYQTLLGKTQSYIDESNLYPALTKNYNVFINKSKGPVDIPETNQKECVTRSSISNLSLAAGFATAYPNNFANYTDANNACKLWAADTGKTTYAITKDAVGKYQCSTGTGLASTITAKSKPVTAYTVFQGDGNATQGGLFANGQIGVWGGTSDPKWNITNMAKPALLKKYNSTDYSSGPKGVENIVRDNWWGTPGVVGGWGGNIFPNDKQAWWISNTDYMLMGNMGYFYFVYNSPVAKNIAIFHVSDNSFVVKVNGQTLSGGAWLGATLVAGKNVFEYQLINSGGPGAFVLYAFEPGNNNNVIFRSGDAGWGYMMTPVPDYKMITNTTIDQGNPNGIHTVNPVPTGYDKCDSLIGGGVQKASINATYGRNCSNVTNPPLNVRYVKVMPNNNGDYIQIAQIVVNAFINGASVNVAPRGTCTAANAWHGWDVGTKNAAIKAPITGGWLYHSAHGPGSWWQLDLGRDYAVTEIVYYNRTDCCQDRALGMKLQLTANDGTVYQPVTLTAALKQHFNASANGLSNVSPVNLGGYQYTKAEAKEVCAKRGARLCTKSELNNSDFCSCGWTSDLTTPGYPMAHGDQTGKGWCGGANGGQVWRDCGPVDWVLADGTVFNWGQKPDGNRHASAFCCK